MAGQSSCSWVLIKAHVLLGHGFSDRLGINEVVLVRLAVRCLIGALPRGVSQTARGYVAPGVLVVTTRLRGSALPHRRHSFWSSITLHSICVLKPDQVLRQRCFAEANVPKFMSD